MKETFEALVLPAKLQNLPQTAKLFAVFSTLRLPADSLPETYKLKLYLKDDY